MPSTEGRARHDRSPVAKVGRSCEVSATLGGW